MIQQKKRLIKLMTGAIDEKQCLIAEKNKHSYLYISFIIIIILNYKQANLDYVIIIKRILIY